MQFYKQSKDNYVLVLCNYSAICRLIHLASLIDIANYHLKNIVTLVKFNQPDFIKSKISKANKTLYSRHKKPNNKSQVN